MIRRPPRSPLFPNPPLFRAVAGGGDARAGGGGRRAREARGGPPEDGAGKPPVGRLHGPRGEEPRPPGSPLPDHAHPRHARARHRERATRHRDRSGLRRVLRARPPGPADRGAGGAGAHPRGARAGARAPALTMLGRSREPARAYTDPVGRALVRLHLRPNHLTVLGFGVSVLAASAFVAGQLKSAGLLLIVAGLCDFFDGAVARVSGQVTTFGAFLDSVIDRYSDLVVMLGIVVLFARTPHARGAVVAMAGLMGSMMVSYTKARAESVGVTCTVGLMERPERLICLIAGALLNLLEPALWVLAVLSNLTALQRIAFTRRATRDAALLRGLVLAALLLLPSLTAGQPLVEEPPVAGPPSTESSGPETPAVPPRPVEPPVAGPQGAERPATEPPVPGSPVAEPKE